MDDYKNRSIEDRKDVEEVMEMEVFGEDMEIKSPSNANGDEYELSHGAGNIILNHDFSLGLHHWHPNSCEGHVVSGAAGSIGRVSADSKGNYVIVKNRTECWQGLEQDITARVSPACAYKVFAMVRISGPVQGPSQVQATLKLESHDSSTNYLFIGRAFASKDHWEKLEGTFSLESIPKRVVFYLEGPPSGVDLLIQSVVVSSSVLVEYGTTSGGCRDNGDDNIIINPQFDYGLNNWSGRGCKILIHDSMADGKILPMQGKFFASATERTQSWNGIQQDITGRVQRKLAYEVTAIVRIFGNDVTSADATDKEWVQLKGKFLLNSAPSKVVVYLEGPPPGTDILLNSLVLKHATKIPPSPPPVIENVAFGVNIIENSDLNDSLNGWFPLGQCSMSVASGSPLLLPPAARESVGNVELLSGHYIHVSNRTQTWMGPAQMITDKLSSSIEKQPSKVMVYIQGPSSGVDLMVAGLHIFPVDRLVRFKYLKHQTDKIRRRDVILKFSGNASSLAGAFLKVVQTQNGFPIGSCISRTNIDNEDFVDFFVKNFNYAVFGNELKWYWTEPQQGNLNYKDADDLLDLCKSHNIDARGHCIFWEVEATVQSWIRSLNKTDLMTAVQNRLTSLLTRYKGKFKHYDVNNEMLHGSFYQDRLGKDIRSYMFKTANQLDPSATLFVNDYHVEDGCDTRSSPERYIEHILDLQSQGAPVGGIGIQGHIDSPVGTVVASAMDKLGILGLPIWFTELDVSSINEYVRADDLEVMLREAFAHPAVDGIMLWGFWELFMSRDNAHLVDAEGGINEAGKRFLQLKKEWLSHARGPIDSQGEFKFRGFDGAYVVEIDTLSKKFVKTFTVDKGSSPLVVNIDL
ncbi:hypothetical protein Syun_015502 [Stephania yunnanensis]|uniref:GH10 domain-containing protein n=1 Tax=Stephania yunnanensis TaxID=152371 RepID=A0AAP0JNM9_9MAGN